MKIIVYTDGTINLEKLKDYVYICFTNDKHVYNNLKNNHSFPVIFSQPLVVNHSLIDTFYGGFTVDLNNKNKLDKLYGFFKSLLSGVKKKRPVNFYIVMTLKLTGLSNINDIIHIESIFKEYNVYNKMIDKNTRRLIVSTTTMPESELSNPHDFILSLILR